ncbi:LptF/LptG family permease [Desulfopila aestuarii]|uniref:Lipopolysaccharide export system permease protein n=1 Tax=Desulfopila aestuarii DSM 18488 TaxID=1121416 RepID=A0A1M7Y3V2_9BACT|nr:LptF/LptG family permease [Desulfopila aestuarii]SHO46910.1 lipopolysaccharide export system permease protein [Desulfopila aestuarii DSM 18488]
MNVFSRSPLILYSYLATEMLAPFFAAFLIMNGVFFLVKLIPFLNFALDFGIGFADFIRLFSYMLPNMLLYTVPMAAMMGTIICFSRLSNDTEILALKAGGISIYQILPSVIIVAFTIAIATSYVSISLIAKSETSLKQLTYQLLKEKMDRGIREGQFTEALGDLVVHVGEIDRATGEWKNVWVSDMRGQKTPAVTMASSGSMVSDIRQMNVTILLRNGSLHRPDGPNAQIVNFEKYVINIPLQLPARAKVNEKNTYTLSELLVATQKYGPNTEKGRNMLVEFHKRLVLPFGCLIMSLLGLPLGLLAGPGKKAIGIPLGLATFILYYVLFSTFKNMAEEGAGSILLLMWLPNTMFLIGAIYSIRRVAEEQPILPEFFHEFARRTHLVVFAPLFQKIGLLYASISKAVSRRMIPAKPSASDDQAQQHVVADPVKNLFHLPNCQKSDSTTATVIFDSIKEAQESGFQPCDYCITLVDQLRRTSKKTEGV